MARPARQMDAARGRSTLTRLVLLAGLAAAAGGIGGAAAPQTPQSQARERAWRHSLQALRLMPVAREDSLLAVEFTLPTAEKVGLWARRFAAADSVVYRFGLRPGGYVSDGALVDDRHLDCVSLLYRVSELARARNDSDAIAWALRTRFAGGAVDSIVSGDGRVDYGNPAHLDFSLDMIRSGWWGHDVTTALTGARIDSAGSRRYPAGSFRFVDKSKLVASELETGDVVWFVLDPAQEKAAALRREYGLVIGHIGLVVVDDGEPWLVHAAASGLPGRYEGGTVVSIPLAEYLARVEKFAGVKVTRF